MHSVSNIQAVPDIHRVFHVSQSLAILDAIFSPEWEYRYFSFDSNWNQGTGHKMASMRNGEGDGYFLLFNQEGVVGKILFANERHADAGSIVRQIPDCFDEIKKEPAFSMNNLSYCIWCTPESPEWQTAPRNRDSYPLLKFLCEDHSYYMAWARDYYETDLQEEAVKQIFDKHTITDELISTLNPNAPVSETRNELSDMLACPPQHH